MVRLGAATELAKKGQLSPVANFFSSPVSVKEYSFFYMKSIKPYERFSEVFNNEEKSSDEFTSEDSSSTQDSPQSTSHVTDASFTTEGFKIISDTVKC